MARGTAVRKWVGSHRNSPGSYRKAYNIEYEYRTAEGEVRADDDQVGEGYRRQLKPQDTIEVIYLPGHPGHSRLARDWRPLLSFILLAVGGCCAGLGGIILLLEVREVQKKVRQTAPRACGLSLPAWAGYIRRFLAGATGAARRASAPS